MDFPTGRSANGELRKMNAPIERKPETESDPMFWVAIAIQILAVAVLFMLLTAFIGMPLIIYKHVAWFWPTVISFGLASIGWALILFKSPMFGWWFIYTQPNHRRVLANQITRDKLAKDLNVRLETKELASMREIGSGWRGKWPPEYRVGAPINMQSEILIGTGVTPLKVYTRKGENIGLLLHWQLTTTPFPGRLVRLVRQSQEAIISNFKAEIDQFFIQTVKTMSEEEVFELSPNPKHKGKSKLAARFEEFYGNDDVADPREMDVGVSTKKLTLLSIDRTEAYQKTAEALAVADNMALVMDKLRRGLGDNAKNIPADVLLMMTAAIAGKVDGLKPIMLTGLGNGNVDQKVLAALLAQK